MPNKIEHIFVDNVEHKWCGHCKEYVDVAQFGKETKKRDGLKCRCKPCNKEYNKKYREIHGKEIDKKDWQKRKNDEKYRKYQLEYRKPYEKAKRINDLNFKIKKNTSRRIRELLSGVGGKQHTTNKYIGCSIDYLKDHLEQQFQESMSWSNYGDWHIDHIIPCAAFDLTDKFQQKACFHYTNLQPLWASENITKSDNYSIRDKEEYLERVKSCINI
tara:strand:+ start:1036 stop:1683 length:648 start_codon:yes stop_codon:yes gene_type:complete